MVKLWNILVNFRRRNIWDKVTQWRRNWDFWGLRFFPPWEKKTLLVTAFVFTYKSLYIQERSQQMHFPKYKSLQLKLKCQYELSVSHYMLSRPYYLRYVINIVFYISIYSDSTGIQTVSFFISPREVQEKQLRKSSYTNET